MNQMEPVTTEDTDDDGALDESLMGPRGDPAEGARNIPEGEDAGSDADREAARKAAEHP